MCSMDTVDRLDRRGKALETGRGLDVISVPPAGSRVSVTYNMHGKFDPRGLATVR